MECTERSKGTKDEFKKEILIEKKNKKQIHFGIVFLSLNILHHIASWRKDEKMLNVSNTNII